MQSQNNVEMDGVPRHILDFRLIQRMMETLSNSHMKTNLNWYENQKKSDASNELSGRSLRHVDWKKNDI